MARDELLELGDAALVVRQDGVAVELFALERLYDLAVVAEVELALGAATALPAS